MKKKPTAQELREAAERFQTGSYSDSPYEKDEWYGPVQLHEDMKMLATHYAKELLARKQKDTNPRLATAAPKLLEALVKLVTLNHTQGVTDEEYEAAEEQADNAIAEAEGK